MELSIVERKIYGALVMRSNEEGSVKINSPELAQAIGYKAYGGIMTYAIQALQFKNYLTKVGKNEYVVHL